MNALQNIPRSSMTLEMICHQKVEKLAEIQASKQRMTQKVHEIFHPSEATDESSPLMNNFHSGIAILNGIMTGFKIIKRIRDLFRRK